jgi:hypothetical protein
MEVSGQLHALAAVPPEKEPPVPIGQEVGSLEITNMVRVKKPVVM